MGINEEKSDYSMIGRIPEKDKWIRPEIPLLQFSIKQLSKLINNDILEISFYLPSPTII